MRLATTTAWIVLPIVAGAGLYLLKMRVETQEQRLVALQKQIVDTRQSIHVLEAEWSYLNDPARLRDEADRLLSMRTVEPRQIVSLDQVPFADPVVSSSAPAPSATPSAHASVPADTAAPTAAPRARALADASDPIGAAIAALATPPRRKHP